MGREEPAGQMSTYQRGNIHQEDTACSATEYRNLGVHACSMKFRSENQSKEAQRSLVGEQERTVFWIERL